MNQPLADLNAPLATLHLHAAAFAREVRPTFLNTLTDTRTPGNAPFFNVELRPWHVRVRFSVPTPPGQNLGEQALAVARFLGTDDVRPGTPYLVIHHDGNHLFTEVRLQEGNIEVILTQLTTVCG